MEAVSFDDTLGEIGKVVEGGLSEDRVIPVNSIDMYEVIADFERGTRAHRIAQVDTKYKTVDRKGSWERIKGVPTGGQLGTNKGGRYRPQLARSGSHRTSFH